MEMDKYRPMFTRSFSVNKLKPQDICHFSSVPLKETNNSKIENFVVASNQNIIIADETNQKLKMLNLHGDFLSELPLRTKPCGMCMWAAAILIVSLPLASMLVVIKITKTNLFVEAGLKTKTGYELIATSKNNILICSHGNKLDIYRVGPQYSLDFIYNINIPENTQIATSPKILLTEDGTILVANIFDSHILTYNNLGELTSYGQIPEDCLLLDIAYFENHLYIVDQKEDRIVQLSMDLKLVSSIQLSSNSRRIPTKISISPNGFLALLYTSFHSTLKIYSL